MYVRGREKERERVQNTFQTSVILEGQQSELVSVIRQTYRSANISAKRGVFSVKFLMAVLHRGVLHSTRA